MENNDLALGNVDKSKAMVIIDKNKLKENVNNFIKENHLNMLNKDPTEIYQKQSNAWHHIGHNTHLLQYCCHNTGFNHRDFKFSVLNLKKTLQVF